ncbi:unnamed protein product [Calypogeia fissa]
MDPYQHIVRSKVDSIFSMTAMFKANKLVSVVVLLAVIMVMVVVIKVCRMARRRRWWRRTVKKVELLDVRIGDHAVSADRPYASSSYFASSYNSPDIRETHGLSRSVERRPRFMRTTGFSVSRQGNSSAAHSSLHMELV